MASMLAQAASGLACLHESGLIHGDIKPSNVMVERQESENLWQVPLLFLSDMDSSLGAAEAVCRFGQVTGTVGYMAPELLEGDPPSRSTDIFALGAWLYWLITGQEPFVGATLETSLLKLRTSDNLAPCARFDTRFSARFWDELLQGMVSSRPLSRFSGGLELLRFVARHSPEVQTAATELLKVVWNPLALLPEEEEAADRLAEALKSPEQPSSLILVLQTRHQTTAQDTARRALVQAGYDPWPLVLLPEDPSHGRLERLLNADWSGVIVDDSSPQGGFSIGELDELLRLCVLARQSAAGSTAPIILLQQVGSDLRGAAAGGSLEMLCNVHVITPSIPRRQDRHIWATGLFSGLTIHAATRECLNRFGHGSGGEMRSVMALALRKGVLGVAEGSVQIDPERAAGFMAEAESLKDAPGVSYSAEAAALLDILGRLPDGLSAELQRHARASVPEYADAELELLALGAAVKDASTNRLLPYRKGTRPASILTGQAQDVRRRVVRALCNGVGCDGPRQTRDPNSLAIQLLDDSPSSRVLRRAAAYCRRAVEANRLEDARALVESGQHLTPELRNDLAMARWLEARSQIWDACDESDRAVEDSNAALRIYKRRDRLLLAARVAARLATGWAGRARATESDASIQEARSLLSHCGGKSAARMGLRVKAEEAFIRRWLGASEESTRLAREVVDGPVHDAAAWGLAFRVLGVDALHRGEVREARLFYAAALKHARRSRDWSVLMRAQGTVAGFEFSHGHYSRAGRILSRLVGYPPGTVRPVDRLNAFGGIAGIAYEAGRVRESAGVNLRIFAATGQDRNTSQKRQSAHNLGLNLLEMGRLPESLSMLRVALEAWAWKSSTQGRDPRIAIAEVLRKIGDFPQCRVSIEAFLADQGMADALTKQGYASQILAQVVLDEGSPSNALRHALAAKQKFESVRAVDEILKTDYLILECERATLPPAEVLARLTGLEARARELRNWRLETRFRVSRLTWDESADPRTRVAELNEILRDCFDRGYAILDLPMLELKARLLMKLGAPVEAQDVLREALARIKAVSSAFTDRRLRDIYLADPRRQRFLDLIRASRDPGTVQS